MLQRLRLLALSFLVAAAATASRAGEPAQHTFVIVHGATGGGWDWKAVDRILTADHHTVYRPTLTGLGERVHLASPDINLTTHINDVVNLIIFEDLHDVILAGHSYGGMVITGVMDRIPERISQVIFLDAAAPGDGMSARDVWGDLLPLSKVVDGQVHFPWLDDTKPYPRDVPQSLKTFTEPVSYKNPAAKRLPVTYVLFVPPGQTLEERVKEDDGSWQRAKARGWKLRTLASDHVAERTHIKEVAALLEEAATDGKRP